MSLPATGTTREAQMSDTGAADGLRQPDAGRLVEALALSEPLIGFYDAPDPEPFAPCAQPPSGAGRGACVFDYRRRWLQGEWLHLTRESHVCGGAQRSLCGVQTRSREDFIAFLCDDEGLRASRELMAAWIDTSHTYQPRHEHLIIGPLVPQQYDWLRTVTFYVNADQLSVLQHGAYYDSDGTGPPPVIVPFSSGCGELISVFDDLDIPQAAVGSTDIAMRHLLPANLLAFTVTRPMFERLCALDERSFLGKGFLKRLKKARGHAWGRS
jgi:hypothetical protein